MADRIKTVILETEKKTVTFSSGWEAFAVRNDGESDICVTAFPDKEAGDDDTLYIHPGESAVYWTGAKNDTCYILGEVGGWVTVMAQASRENPFKSARKGGGEVRGKITPRSLGYTEAGCQNFFDGIYNTGYSHSDSPQSCRYWFDLMGNGILRRCRNGDYPDMEKNCYTTEKGYFPSVLRMDIAISFQQSFTYEVVFRCTEWPSSASTAYMVISNTNASGAGLQFNYHEIQFILHNGSNYIRIGAPEDAYKDVFVVAQMTYGDGIAKLYLNGELIGSDSVPSIKHTTEPIYIGSNGGETEYQGAMKAYRVALYDRPLTEEELLQNYRRDLERFHN